MYRVTYEQLLEILEKCDCPSVLAEIKDSNLDPESIKTIEIDFVIEDVGTEYEIQTVNEFSIYTKNNEVFYGYPLRHDCDFTLESRPTKPSPVFTVLGQERMDLPDAPPGAKENLEFLLERALDACEYADTSEEKHTGYAECDKAYADVANTLGKMSVKMNLAKMKTRRSFKSLSKNNPNDLQKRISRNANEQGSMKYTTSSNQAQMY